MARGAFRSRVARAPRRQTQWIGSSDSTAAGVAGAANVVFDQVLPESALLDLYPFTIVRTRGILWVKSDQVAASEEPFGALGMAVVPERTHAVGGVTALPAPIADESSDVWFIHQFWLGSMQFGDGTGFNADAYMAYAFDSRAQRKVQAGEAIVVMLENASASHGAKYVVKFRMLTKLS